MRGNIHAFIKLLIILHQGAVKSLKALSVSLFWDGLRLGFQVSLAENPNLHTHPQLPLVSSESRSHTSEPFSYESCDSNN